MQTIPTQIHLEDGKAVKLVPVNSTGWCMRFQAIGDYSPRQPESISATEYISEFSKAELFLFREVSKHVEGNNKLTLRPSSYTPAEQAKLKLAIPLWIKKGLLIRIKREYYLVNPWFLVPTIDEQVNVMNYWKVLNHKP